MKPKSLSRRDLLKAAGMVAGGAALAACGPQATPEAITVTVKETVVVEGESKIVEVEKVVTAAPPDREPVEITWWQTPIWRYAPDNTTVLGACILFSIGFGIHSRVRNNALGVGGDGEGGGNYDEGPSVSSGGRQSLASLSMPRGGPKSFVFRVTQRNERGGFMASTMQYVRANSRWDAERQIKGQYPSGTLIMYISEE